MEEMIKAEDITHPFDHMDIRIAGKQHEWTRGCSNSCNPPIETLRTIAKYASTVWGGILSIIVEVDKEKIDEKGWLMLKLFNPDTIYSFNQLSDGLIYELTNKVYPIKIVADYDDAFFHRYDQNNSFLIRNLLKNKIDSVMEYADMVLAGNNYLLERAKLSNRNVKLFPTVVDINKFKNSNPIKDDVFTIGWIGSPGTANYLKIIEDALKEVSLDKDIKINLIGANKIKINSVSINYIKWDENTEVEEISKFDVGIMPLPDNSWERGKCGFKLIQYLSCNLPVIGSPVGVNREIIINGVNGFQANSTDEWIKYIRLLKDDKELMLKMGKNGRRFVEEKYSLQRNVVKLIDYFNELLRV